MAPVASRLAPPGTACPRAACRALTVCVCVYVRARLCVCWGKLRVRAQAAPLLPTGVPLPASPAASPSRLRLQTPADSRDLAPGAGALAAGPAGSAPGPRAHIFVARPPRSIAPSPSPAAGKGHPRAGGEEAAPGTLVARSGGLHTQAWPPAGLSPALAPAPAPQLRFCASLISASALLARPGVLFFARSSFFSGSPSFFLFLCQCLFVALVPCLSHTDIQPPPPWGPHSLLPPS